MQELIISNVITFVVSGGLTTLVTMKFARRDAEASAMEKVQRIYQNVITDLNADRTRLMDSNAELARQNREMSERIKCLSDELDDLRRQVNDLTSSLAARTPGETTDKNIDYVQESCVTSS